MDLSKRLTTVASAVSYCDVMADIGTDHGFVPIYLVKKGVCQQALAMDVNKGPLARAEEHIRHAGLGDRIKTRLSNGLEKLVPGEVNSIVIAGMGGDLMAKILLAGSDVLHPVDGAAPELILQPQSEWFKVRRCLHREGYCIIREDFLYEDGKYYLVIKAVPGEDRIYTPAEYHYSKLLVESGNPVFTEYLEKELEKKERIMESLRADESDKQSARITELKTEIARIKGILS